MLCISSWSNVFYIVAWLVCYWHDICNLALLSMLHFKSRFSILVLPSIVLMISVCNSRFFSLYLSILPVAFWSFVWFVGFCFLANQWQVAKEEDNPLREGADAARAAITFAFFSIFTWVHTVQQPTISLTFLSGVMAICASTILCILHKMYSYHIFPSVPLQINWLHNTFAFFIRL